MRLLPALETLHLYELTWTRKGGVIMIPSGHPAGGVACGGQKRWKRRRKEPRREETLLLVSAVKQPQIQCGPFQLFGGE